MKQDLKNFIEERAERLAIVYLTRRQDLILERVTADSGLDLLVTILQDKTPTGRMFGIQVKGRDKAFQDRQQAEKLGLNEKATQYLQDLPFPVCLFFFTMEDDRGYYQWLKSPSPSNPRQLYVTPQNQWCSLDEDQLSQILQDVNAWYDQKSHSVA